MNVAGGDGSDPAKGNNLSSVSGNTASLSNSGLEKIAEALLDSNQILKEEQSLTKEQIRELRETQKSEREVILKALSKPTKLGLKFFDKQMLNQTATNFPPIPSKRNSGTIADWNKKIRIKLLSPPWCIKDGEQDCSILDDFVTKATRKSDAYTARVKHLSTCLAGLLTVAEDLGATIDALESTILQSNGIVLLGAITEHLVPTTLLDIVFALDFIGSCLHRNGETLDAYEARLDHL